MSNYKLSTNLRPSLNAINDNVGSDQKVNPINLTKIKTGEQQEAIQWHNRKGKHSSWPKLLRSNLAIVIPSNKTMNKDTHQSWFSQLQDLSSTIAHIKAHQEYQFMDRLPNPPESIGTQKSCWKLLRTRTLTSKLPYLDQKPKKKILKTLSRYLETERCYLYLYLNLDLPPHNHNNEALAFFLNSHSLCIR